MHGLNFIFGGGGGKERVADDEEVIGSSIVDRKSPNRDIRVRG